MVRAKVKSWTEKLYDIFGDADKVKGVYVPTRKALRVMPENESLFGEVLMAQRRTSISINSAYGLSKLRQNITTTGTGTADADTKGKIILRTGGDAGSKVQMDSAEVGIYAPGFAAEVGIGIRPQHTLAGTAFGRWGGISVDNQNGFYFKLTADGKIAAVRRNEDVEEDVDDRSVWNIDRFDGSRGKFNPSGINVTATQGFIYQVDFSWYGYGLIVFGIVRQMRDFPDVQHFIPGHVFQIDDGISIAEPNLQIFAEINNGDQTEDYALDVGGMQYSTVGINEGARQRTVDEYVIGVDVDDTSDTHLFSFRRKANFLNRAFLLDQFSGVVSNGRVIFEIWLGGTVTGGTYATATGYDADETSVESVIEQTFDRTGATLLFREIVEAGEKNKEKGNENKGLIDLNLPANGAITLTARTSSGSAIVEVAQLRGREGW